MSKQPLEKLPKAKGKSAQKPQSSHSDGVPGPHTQHGTLPVSHADSGDERKVKFDWSSRSNQTEVAPAAYGAHCASSSRKTSETDHVSSLRRACDPVVGASGSSSGLRPKFIRANHLLNFTPQPRPAQNQVRRPGQKSSHFRSKYNKDDFLQANFRFLVSDAVNVERFTSNADKMFDWEDIAQVEMMVTSQPKCPITLDSPPIAPQITPCGHVFSFSGIMQHLVVSGGEDLRCAAKCPLCFSLIVARELRRVVFQQVEPPKVGNVMVFHLLKRARESIIPEMVGNDMLGSIGDLQCDRFSKFTTVRDAHPTWSADAIHLAETYAQVMSEGGMEAALEGPALCAGLDALAERAKAWTIRQASNRTNPKHTSLEKVGTAAEVFVRKEFARRISSIELHKVQKPLKEAAKQGSPALSVAPKSKSLSISFRKEDDCAGRSPLEPRESFDKEDLALTSPPSTSTVGNHNSPNADNTPAPYYNFYQAADGQLLYMHPANMKCLTLMFGQPSSWPACIEGKIVEVENLVQADATRKRYRHLAHIPITGSYSLVEVDLSHIISSEFLLPIKQREELRSKRTKQKKKEDARQERLANRAAYVSVAPTIEEFRSMPDLSAQLSMSEDKAASFSLVADHIQENGQDSKGGVSWSAVTKLGFTATWGQDPEAGTMSRKFPSLGKLHESQRGLGHTSVRDNEVTAKPSWGTWKSKVASVAPKDQAEPRPPEPFPIPGSTKKGKKSKMILLSNSQRRG